MVYFKGCLNPNDARSRYRKLAKEYHPDLTQDVDKKQERHSIMQAINIAYESILKVFNGSSFYFRGKDGQQKETVYHFNLKKETEIMDKILATIKVGMENVEIDVIGTWIWVSGNTKPYKEYLKGLGYSWNPKRIAWQWHNGGKFKGRYNPKVSKDELKNWYGSAPFEGEHRERISA